MSQNQSLIWRSVVSISFHWQLIKTKAKMKLSLLTFLIPAVLSAAVSNNYGGLAGHQIWKLDGKESALPSKLMTDGLLDILDHSGTSKQVRIAPQHAPKIRKIFEEEGISYQVLVNDLAAHMEAENKMERTRRDTSQKTENCTETFCPKPLTSQYMTFNQMEFYLKELNNSNNPKLSMKSIGKSHEKKDIWLLHIKSDNASAKSIWIEGGLHAREWISPAVAFGLIDKLVNTPDSTKNYDFFIAPMVNPDGYEYTWTSDRYWRKNRRIISDSNCVGVDLNRNWDFKFGVGASTNPCSEIYMGSFPFSEPETQALRDAMTEVKGNLAMVLSLHSYGQDLLYPWGWSNTVAAPNKKELITAGTVFANGALENGGKQYSVINSAGGLYLASGATDDWALGVLNIKYVYTLELRDGGNRGFVLGTDDIQPSINEVWSGLQKLLEYIA